MTCEDCKHFYDCLQEATELGQVFFPDYPSYACDEFEHEMKLKTMDKLLELEQKLNEQFKLIEEALEQRIAELI